MGSAVYLLSCSVLCPAFLEDPSKGATWPEYLQRNVEHKHNTHTSPKEEKSSINIQLTYKGFQKGLTHQTWLSRLAAYTFYFPNILKGHPILAEETAVDNKISLASVRRKNSVISVLGRLSPANQSCERHYKWMWEGKNHHGEHDLLAVKTWAKSFGWSI